MDNVQSSVSHRIPSSVGRRFLFRILSFASCLLLMIGSGWAQTRAGGSSVEDIIRSYHKIIDTNPNYEKMEDIYYELGTLYFQQENETFTHDYRAFLARVKADPNSTEEPPTQTYAKTIAHYLDFLKRYPLSAYTDDVYYHLAFCYQEQMKWQPAMDYYQKITDNYPDSPFAPEAYFRRGEIAFEQDQLSVALDAYKKALLFKSSPLYDEALYKLGWTHYRLSNYADAISILMTVMDKQLAKQKAGAKPSQVTDETQQYLAICFAEYGSARAAEKIFSRLKEPRAYEPEIYIRMGRTFFQRNLYGPGVEAFQVFAERFPTDPRAPGLVNEGIEQAKTDGNAADELRLKTRLVYDYGDSSAWRRANPADSLRMAVDSLRAVRLLEMAADQHRDGNTGKVKTKWEAARKAYQDFITFFPKNARHDDALFRLADCEYRLNNLNAAADAYLKLAAAHPGGEHAEESRYNAIVCYRQLQESRPDSLTLAKLTGEAERFAKDYPLSDHLPNALFARADALFNAKQYEAALTVYTKISEYSDFERDLREQATLQAGKSAFQLGKFSDSEAWFRKAEKVGSGSSGGKSQATELTQRALYEQAKSTLAKGDTLAGARLLLKVDRELPLSDVGGVALLQAGELFEKLGEWQSAADTWSRFLESFPSHAEWGNVLWREALCLEKGGKDELAAEHYSRIPTLNPGDARRANAYVQAVRLYLALATSNAAAAPAWTSILNNINLLKAADVTKTGEANLVYAEGKAYFELQQLDRAKPLLEKFVAMADIGGERRADAYFMLGELDFPAYERMTVKNPVEKTLAEKQDKFGTVMALYTEALKGGLKLSTAASYRIGLLFEDFARKLNDSPRPKGLSKDEKAQYDAALAEQTTPYLQEAKGVYEKVMAKAKESNYQDEWLNKIAERLQAMSNGQ